MKKNSISKEDRELFLKAVYGHKKSQEAKEEDFSKAIESYPVFLKEDLEDARSVIKNTKKKRNIDAKIDLHGLALEDAVINLNNFIAREKKKGSKILLIIHGKGAGILKNAVLSVIHVHIDVFNYQVAPPKLGGEGALIVWINNKGTRRL